MSDFHFHALLEQVTRATSDEKIHRAARVAELGRQLALDAHMPLAGIPTDDLDAVKQAAVHWLRGRAAFQALLRARELARELSDQQARDEQDRAALEAESLRIRERAQAIGHRAQQLNGDLHAACAEADELVKFLPPAEVAWVEQQRTELARVEARARAARRELDSRPGAIEKVANLLALVRSDIGRTTYADRSWLAGLKEREGALSDELAQLEQADPGELRRVIAENDARAAALRRQLFEHEELHRPDWFQVKVTT